jgi:serine/threonine protein kinase
VALKQFPKTKGQPVDCSAKIEVELGSILFPLQVRADQENLPLQQLERGYAVDPEELPGIKNISRLIDLVEDRQDVWLVYEVGAQPLGKCLAEVKGEFFRGERIYNVSHQGFYHALSRNWRIMASLIRKVAETFDVLARFGIVHSDIKPDNILVKLTECQTDIQELKLIDFGSAFQFDNITQISATTPEYLAPEILAFLDQRNRSSQQDIKKAIHLSNICQPWSFDVWSLGVILLEIVTGFPVWMSLKCRASTANGKSVMGAGIFGVQGREGKKILVKQQQLLKNLPATLKKYECYGLNQDPLFMDLLLRMLDFDPRSRISPAEIIASPFCRQFG